MLPHHREVAPGSLPENLVHATVSYHFINRLAVAGRRDGSAKHTTASLLSAVMLAKQCHVAIRLQLRTYPVSGFRIRAPVDVKQASNHNGAIAIGR